MAKMDSMTDDEFIQLLEKSGLENIRIGGYEFSRKKDDNGYYYVARVIALGVITFDKKYVLVDSSNFIRSVTDELETNSLDESIKIVETVIKNKRSKESILTKLGFTHYEHS